MTKKESQACAAISFVLLTVLLLVVFLLCKTRENAVFPVLAAAEEAGLGKIGLVIIYLALFTTCNGTCSVASGDKLSYALLLGCIALPVSCFGFETLIAKIYPAIGTAGCIVSIGAIALYLYKTKTGRKSRGRGNDLDVLVTDNADKSVL